MGSRIHQSVWSLVDQQHGVVARWQLLELGFSPRSIEHRRSKGRLHLVTRGVYAVGRPRLTRHGRWMAAVLSCGPPPRLATTTLARSYGIRSAGQSGRGLTPSSGTGACLADGRLAAAASGTHHSPAHRPRGDQAPRHPCHHSYLHADRHRATVEPRRARSRDQRGRQARSRQRGRAAIRARQGDASAWSRHPSRDARPPHLHAHRLRVASGCSCRSPAARVCQDPRLDSGSTATRSTSTGPIWDWSSRLDGLRYHRTPAQQAADRRRDQAHAAAGLTPLRFTHGAGAI